MTQALTEALADRLARLKVSAAALEDQARRDPLSRYQHASWASEWVCENLHRGWFYWHAANSGAKSHSLAALIVKIARGGGMLGLEGSGRFWDGRPWYSKATELPAIEPPVDIGIGTPSYKLGAAGSIIAKVRELIGEWPHHESRVAESVSVFHVKHERGKSDDWHDFSKIYVFPYEGPVPEAARLDAWFADEPPPELWLSAILNRGKRGRPLYGGIGATPVVPRLWRPVRAQFPDAHCEFIEGRARIQSSVYDNRFLTASDIQRQEYANPPSHPLSKAKLLGDHVNAVGSCPFDLIVLGKMLAECEEPEREVFRIPLESDSGSPKRYIETTIEWFQKPHAGNRGGRLTLDPASGVSSNKNNPLGFNLSADRSGDLLVRWNDKIPPFCAGILAATIARQFDAWIDIEMNDHWGVNVVRGVEKTGYGKLCKDRRLLRPDVWSMETGFRANAETVNEGIGAIQEWIAAYEAGIPYAKCPSRDVIHSIMDTELDENDKVVSPKDSTGAHGEDRVCFGRNLSRCVKRPSMKIPNIGKPLPSPAERMVAKVNGMRREPQRGVLLQQPKQPRF